MAPIIFTRRGAQAIAEHLRRLTSLDVGFNSFGDGVARAIAEQLGQLTSLNIRYNNVSEEGARAIAEHLGRLTRLLIGGNSLNNAAIAAIASGLRSLSHLDLSINERVDDIGPLAGLSTLRHLDITKTSVADLSPLAEFVLNGIPVHDESKSGSEIVIKDCPLVHPSPEIVSQGPAAVLNYFHEIAAQGVDRLYEAKVLILGAGGAGKTSLLRRLFQPSLPLSKVDETTARN